MSAPDADPIPSLEVLEQSVVPAAPVAMPQPPTLANRIAFFFSAVLSPYIVLPVGTLGILYARTTSSQQFVMSATISIFFSTFLPVLYVLAGMKRGTITDVHVMERGQRGGPFVVAIAGGFAAAFVLYKLGAKDSVWGLSLLLAVNGLVIFLITAFTKISVHVSVLSATVLGAIILHPPLPAWTLVWMIPALMWARVERGRHSIWQGVGGCIVSSLVTTATIYALGLGERIPQLFQRVTSIF
ncbi:MAG: hypothetical protein KY445_04405 [Armatimonadetes bacterium]|nr:hypothetical protein [Armatimonadota bacterium]